MFFLCSIASGLVGCRDFGAGGTGEYVAPREKLHTIEPLTLEATTRPATIPTTLSSSTQPVQGEVALSVVDVRRMALSNNLDIRIELINPEVARYALSEEQARFEALITANVDYSKFDTPTASQLSGSQVEDLSFRPGV